ncbi:enoyl-CoA hydratase/isomerase family protein [Rhodococcus sp. ZPP]|uniref:enoyl-CoA hydratase-related protein n=1 Tax=Rhodococcus sp. ZPP TaxID=2749906 RepID=UPI001AD88E6F|nr:enoyl-CoA hydratase-related protein [Rhodococcus sp. ZPP]QTJ65406.1 enoyl-CoA hydratase/isomerase family protein [Rhodococcus sp. ZPP]
MSSGVRFTRDGHIARVTLDRPKALNSINAEMDQSLYEAWTEINADPDLWVAVLSASGEKAFCAGADVSGGTEGDGRRMALGGGLTGVGGPLLKLRKPLVAAVQGYAVGGGFELAMCADVIVAADNAQFGIPETKVGIIGEAGIMHRAIRQLPHHIAMAMILTGDRITAVDAERYGLVNEVVAPEQLGKAADQWAERIAAASPLAVQAAKDAVLSRLDWPLDIALATRYEPIEAYAASADRLEGRAAFAEKRKPQWTGR